MIVIISLIGLAFLSLLLLSKHNSKLAIALLIPLSYASYYCVSVKIPEYFGYAVPLNFVDLDQARFLSGFDNGTVISMMIVEKSKTDPRLVSIPSTQENKKKVEELNGVAKNGAAIIRKSEKGAVPKDGKGRTITESDIESVPMAEQEIITK